MIRGAWFLDSLAPSSHLGIELQEPLVGLVLARRLEEGLPIPQHGIHVGLVLDGELQRTRPPEKADLSKEGGGMEEEEEEVMHRCASCTRSSPWLTVAFQEVTRSFLYAPEEAFL